MRRSHLAPALIALAVAGANVFAADRAPSQDTPEHWQTLARRDIAEAHQALVAAHPGAIDPANPGFRTWLEAGPGKALDYVPRVRSYDDMRSVVSFYIAAFHDGHLAYSDDTRPSSNMTVDGWHVAPRDGSAVVDAVAPDWPVALPPLGAELLGCDGLAARSLVADDIAPFTQAPVGDAGQAMLWGAFTDPPLGDMRWKSCSFKTADGHRLELSQAWKEVPWDVFGQLVRGGRKPPMAATNSAERLPDGTLWLRAGNFQPNAEQNAALEQLIETLRKAPTARRIVFDARRNNGGDSGIGQRLFMATTGGLEIDDFRPGEVATTSAWWRVSDIAIDGMVQREAIVKQRGGDDSTLQVVKQLHQALVAAQAGGDDWVHQPGGDYPRLTREDMAARKAHLNRPVEKVALLTDATCVSACLDFADMIRSVPGSVHIGQTTGADTVYLDIGRVPLPSGNVLILPLKVWRNRPRGNNETLVPDVPLSFDQGSEDAVRRAVMQVLDRPAAPAR